jgi:hypothetical protein
MSMQWALPSRAPEGLTNRPRRPRPPHTERSEHWMRVAANEAGNALNQRISDAYGWTGEEIS